MKGTTLTNIVLGGAAIGIGAAILSINIIALMRNRRVRGY